MGKLATTIKRTFPRQPTIDHKATYRDKRWPKLRLLCLARYPICTRCNRHTATVAHHVTPIDQGGSKFDLANLTGLCWNCHEGHHNRLGKAEQIEWDKFYRDKTNTDLQPIYHTIDQLAQAIAHDQSNTRSQADQNTITPSNAPTTQDH